MAFGLTLRLAEKKRGPQERGKHGLESRCRRIPKMSKKPSKVALGDAADGEGRERGD